MGMDAHYVRTTYVSFSEGKCESYIVRRTKEIHAGAAGVAGRQFLDKNLAWQQIGFLEKRTKLKTFDSEIFARPLVTLDHAQHGVYLSPERAQLVY